MYSRNYNLQMQMSIYPNLLSKHCIWHKQVTLVQNWLAFWKTTKLGPKMHLRGVRIWLYDKTAKLDDKANKICQKILFLTFFDICQFSCIWGGSWALILLFFKMLTNFALGVLNYVKNNARKANLGILTSAFASCSFYYTCGL